MSKGRLSSFHTRSRANWFPLRSCARKSSSPRRNWWKLRKAPRIASHRSARILANAADALTSTSATNISWRLNGGRCATFFSESASLRDIPLRPIIPSPKPYGYRNRITVHAQDGVIGFFRRDSHRLIDVERCPISCDEVNRELMDLRGRNPRDGHYTLRTSSESARLLSNQ